MKANKNKVKHTPGPWEIMHASAYREFRIFGHDHGYYQIAVINAVEDQDSANAKLIAAAPELLEACRAALENWKADGTPQDQGLYELLENAIAKAEGKV